MFKCSGCKTSNIPDVDLKDGLCPVCGGAVIEMCVNDPGPCSHGVVDGVKVCDVCGAFICPVCGSHDVEVLSRTTGYYGPISSFNSGKKAEFADRYRYTIE